MRTRVHTERSTKGVWSPNATVELVHSGDASGIEDIEALFDVQRQIALAKLKLAISELENAYPFDASKA